jgi:hypothetical protein
LRVCGVAETVIMGDEYRERMLAIVEDIAAQGVGRYTSAPPIYRLAWRLGIHVRSPLYQSFATLALGQGALFGIMGGFLVWWLDGLTVSRGFTVAIIGGMFFGLIMAGYTRRTARRLRLPLIAE